jgi:hypothetical protein
LTRRLKLIEDAFNKVDDEKMKEASSSCSYYSSDYDNSLSTA